MKALLLLIAAAAASAAPVTPGGAFYGAAASANILYTANSSAVYITDFNAGTTTHYAEQWHNLRGICVQGTNVIVAGQSDGIQGPYSLTRLVGNLKQQIYVTESSSVSLAQPVASGDRIYFMRNNTLYVLEEGTATSLSVTLDSIADPLVVGRYGHLFYQAERYLRRFEDRRNFDTFFSNEIAVTEPSIFSTRNSRLYRLDLLTEKETDLGTATRLLTGITVNGRAFLFFHSNTDLTRRDYPLAPEFALHMTREGLRMVNPPGPVTVMESTNLVDWTTLYSNTVDYSPSSFVDVIEPGQRYFKAQMP